MAQVGPRREPKADCAEGRWGIDARRDRNGHVDLVDAPRDGVAECRVPDACLKQRDRKSGQLAER